MSAYGNMLHLLKFFSQRQASTEDADLIQGQRLLIHAGHLLRQALGQEQVPQGSALHGEDELGELLLLHLSCTVGFGRQIDKENGG